MSDDAVMRTTLWTSVALNGVGATLFAFPDSAVGRLLGLPPPVPRLYSTLCALFVALFGCAYVWLARQPDIDRPMVAFAAVAKASVFAVFLCLWLLNEAPGLGVLMVTPHLGVACIFAWWLGRHDNGE